jgi:hypothetical protein
MQCSKGTCDGRNDLLDHVVSDGEHARRNNEAKSPGGVEIDNQLELGELQDRQVGGLRAFEDLTGVDADLTPHIRTVGPIAHQPGFDMLPNGVGRRNPMARRERRKLDAPADEEPVGGNKEGVGPLVH